MKGLLVRFFRGIRILAHKLIPNEDLKVALGRYYTYWMNPLYDLNKMITKTELGDDSLCVELTSGLRFYGRPDRNIHTAMLHTNPKKMGKIADFKYYNTFLQALAEQFVLGGYDKYYHLTPGETVVDVGANVGVFTVKAAKVVGETGKVIAIEPELDNLATLLKNIQANNLRNVIVVTKGAWSHQTTIRLYLAEGVGEHSCVRESERFRDIAVDSLDNIVTELGIKEVNFIKMDIEGAEIEALKGMSETLRKSRYFAGEWHVVDGTSTYDLIAKRLKEQGFTYHKEIHLIFGTKQ